MVESWVHAEEKKLLVKAGGWPEDQRDLEADGLD